ncbi:FAD-dependent oxidoreductase [Rhodoblastus acidophilus]|uniref:FAD-dependent oxidoreductase n=1 Tax=Candidatus Rhodoblastus alkanivorans TaxID=2954117 RepID=A0ABS9Z372_9HYPH|nr:FAD-dependent oxidoreductase [Candidatus Rhodoblastus alkanivorans]MCI4677327.1 FAD-dependent oxidoreductase [Candidatus Rhodoblastus alkanivorans]MCI4682062.1 FAD-dependent oxidoreductase [Candidatus Rhodoblastus alkanivorans]MDI4639364.1 FAD-dependent oxidoreductase [Rhodoblastus acidophilus]
MAEDQSKTAGPDLTRGVECGAIPDGGKLLGHVGEAQVLVVRVGAEFFAVDAFCTHYHGPLADGLVADGALRCPWHHACFDLRTGEALRPPAFGPLACWSVEQRNGRIFVREQRKSAATAPRALGGAPERIVIVGGGAAGFAAAEKLRREHYQGSIVMLSDDDAPPVDRPNLSKDYLAGSAPEEWVPLQPEQFYAESGIDLRLKANVTALDPQRREVILCDGGSVPYDRLLLATGAEPVRLPISGADRPHVHALRSFSDCQAIIAAAGAARRAVVIGASFIGLEAAAALRARKIEVHVVAPEARPMERILGPEMGDFIRALHEEHGVVFHLEEKPAAIEDRQVILESGKKLDADLVILGVGVRPRTQLAEAAGLRVDRGVTVDAYLETSAPGVFAAGDIARWPDPHGGAPIRVEHWVVAERQGQTAALNMLGRRQQYAAVPFFWSQHYDVPINYVGHAENWDDLTIEGDIRAKDCLLRFNRNGRALAVASIFRDLESLKAELAMERDS